MPYKDVAKQREYQNAWIQRRRQDWFAENGPCVDCETWSELQLDHVNADSKISHKIWTWTEARRLAELAKCVARCRLCHELKTISNFEGGNRKITISVAHEIRQRYSLGDITQRALGLEFGLSQGAVSKIVRMDSWKSL